MTQAQVEAPPETRQCNYTFSADILHVRGALQFGPDIIAVAERLSCWARAGVIGQDGVGHYGAERNNDSIEVAARVHCDLAPFEQMIASVLHGCVYAYKTLNKHLVVSRDTGYHLLRYGPGQFFGEHVDAVAGQSGLTVRQLSVLAFLNGGFDGGELVFPRQGLVVQPAQGDVLLWPSAFTHPHAARPVVRGTKYSLVSWLV